MQKPRTLAKLAIFFVATTSLPLIAYNHTPLIYEADAHAIVSHLKVYQAYDMDGPILLSRIGRSHDGGYVVPGLSIEKADVIIGYGISDDISFEESATAIYGKPSYGFDCTCPPVHVKQENCHFIPSCIVGKQSNQSFHSCGSFDQHLRMIEANGKKLFVKMDIEGNEYETLPDILEHAHNITGIALEVHFLEQNQFPQALALLEKLDKDFLLVHVHGINYCNYYKEEGFFRTSNSIGNISRVLELSYINKNLVHRYELSKNQSHPTLLDMPNNQNDPDIEFTVLE